MKMMVFEWKKLWKQKKILLILTLIIAYGMITYLQNVSDQDRFKEQLYHDTENVRIELAALMERFAEEQEEGELDQARQDQEEYAKEAQSALYALRADIDTEQWVAIPEKEKNFLAAIESFTESGGVLSSLNGHELDLAIQKNNWLNKYELPVENERVPVSPHSFTKEFSTTILSIAGLALILLLLGNSLVGEKEQNTWLLIKTQPVSKRRVLIAKYFTMVFALLCTVIITIGSSILIALAFGDGNLTLHYPVLLSDGTRIEIITIGTYLIRLFILFFSAGLIAFSINMIFNSLLNQSFIAIACTFVVLGSGILLTHSFQILETYVNPFSLFLMSDLLERIPGNTDVLYLLSAALWSTLLLWVAIKIPDQQRKRTAAEKEQKPFRKGETYNKTNRLWIMMVFEWRKLVRKGLYKQGMLLLTVLVLGGYLLVSMESKAREEAYIAELQERKENEFIFVENLTAFIESFEKDLEDQDDDFMKSSIQKNIDMTYESIGLSQDFIKQLDRALNGYEEKDWSSFNDYLLWQVRFDNGEYDTETYINNRFELYGQFTVQASMEEKRLLVERNLQPLFPGAYIPTIFDNWGDDEEGRQEFQKANEKVDHSGLYTFYLFFTSYGYGIVFFVLLFVLGVGLTAEKGKKNTIRLLATQPISGYQLFSGKLLVASLTAVLSSAFIFGLIVLLGTTMNRIGDWNYPILHYDHSDLANAEGYTGTIVQGNGFHFITLGEYLLSSMMLYTLLVLFTLTLAMLVSLFLKRTMAVLTLTAVIIAGGYLIGTEFLSEWSWLSPFTYFNLPHVINGQLSINVDAPNLNRQIGAIVLVVWIVVTFFICSIAAIRRNIEY
ncbi:hypothetical protein JMA_02280 [Jeotgalibacillus malaysiensis]|uniref:ABC-2 type transporter transmembrane domain-containing protein n=1 Tax=Jeotgalibacillus malaysiensis TaxID=1508404 RepID=A0A0B5AGQ2_9BACL|nr:ABC transporter permease [Jeotgalibacillus malaysiensis]AJD89545.1 hypothetical protein JMA_02280 [Jeotgalibacillus malaysiensis]